MSNTIDTIFMQAAALEGQIDAFHFIGVPVTLSIVNAETEVPLPSTTDPNARVDEIDSTLNITGRLTYVPAHVIGLDFTSKHPFIFRVPASFVAHLSGFEDISGRGTGGTNPTRTDVSITITPASDPAHARVSIGSSDSLAHISALFSRSVAPIQLSQGLALPQDQPGFSHADSVHVVLTLGDAARFFQEPKIRAVSHG